MKYQMELEVEIADDKSSFAEEFFKSISFVRKVKTSLNRCSMMVERY
jgi:hypothetical protein